MNEVTIRIVMNDPESFTFTFEEDMLTRTFGSLDNGFESACGVAKELFSE